MHTKRKTCIKNVGIHYMRNLTVVENLGQNT